MFLTTFEYDQDSVSDLTHALDADEAQSLYSGRCEVELLDTFVTSSLPKRLPVPQSKLNIPNPSIPVSACLLWDST